MASRLSALLFVLASLVVSNAVFALTCAPGFHQDPKGANCKNNIAVSAEATFKVIELAHTVVSQIIEQAYSRGEISKEIRNQMSEIKDSDYGHPRFIIV